MELRLIKSTILSLKLCETIKMSVFLNLAVTSHWAKSGLSPSCLPKTWQKLLHRKYLQTLSSDLMVFCLWNLNPPSLHGFYSFLNLDIDGYCSLAGFPSCPWQETWPILYFSILPMGRSQTLLFVFLLRGFWFFFLVCFCCCCCCHCCF